MIPFLDLNAQYRRIKPEINAAVARVLDSGQFVLGPDVFTFEQRFAKYCGTEHCLAVNTGTSALHLALLAGGIGPGDEVITVSLTFVATTAAILYTGATPVFVDVDPSRWTMDARLIEGAVTRRTKAIVPVHLHGQMADMAPIMEIARRYGLLVIEDAAQAHGGEYMGRRAGSVGDLGCFSFYPGKNLGAYGEGGAVVCSDPQLARRVRLLRDWGQESKYNHVLPGYNYRMDTIQAAVLNVKMNHLEAWTEARIAVAQAYNSQLRDDRYQRPQPAADTRHVFHVYAVTIDRRDTVLASMQEAGIGVGIHYPVPVHLQKAYAGLAKEPMPLPVTEALAKRFLSLPIYPELLTDQIEDVVHLLHDIVASEPA